MERLTEKIKGVAFLKFRNSKYKYSPCWGCKFNDGECEQNSCSYSSVLDKLAEYEDLGYSPEELKQRLELVNIYEDLCK